MFFSSSPFLDEVFSGKKLTPAILNYLFKETKGKTLKSNIELVKNNAIFGSKVALGLN